MKILVFEQVEKVLRKETRAVKEDVQDILEMLELDLNIGLPHIRSLASIHKNLFEIRVKDRAGQFRIIFLKMDGSVIYLIHAFRKKTEQLPAKEIKLIKKRLKEIS